MKVKKAHLVEPGEAAPGKQAPKPSSEVADVLTSAVQAGYEVVRMSREAAIQTQFALDVLARDAWLAILGADYTRAPSEAAKLACDHALALSEALQAQAKSFEVEAAKRAQAEQKGDLAV